MTPAARGAPRRGDRSPAPPGFYRSRAGELVPKVNFEAIAAAALPHVEALCARWLPAGKRVGSEWKCGDLAGNPGRSLSINLHTGRWADFASGDRGKDVISLAAAIHNMSQVDAAKAVAGMLGLDPGGRHV